MNASHMVLSSLNAASVAGCSNALSFDRTRSAKASRGSSRHVDAGAGQGRVAIDIDTIDRKGCVIIQREGLHSSPPEDMEAPYAAKDEFESLQESMHASTASSKRGGASCTPLDIGSGDALDEIHKAHGT